MAYNLEKLTKLRAIQQLAEKIKSGYASKEELKEAVDAKISSTYRAGGSVPPDNLPALTEENVGLVVNVSGEFTTTDSFVEGAGKTYPAGTNLVVTGTDGNYRYDVLGGFVDLSGYVKKEDGKGLSSNDFTDDDKAALDSLTASGGSKVEASDKAGYIKVDGVDIKIVDIATDQEVAEMLKEVFAPAGGDE